MKKRYPLLVNPRAVDDIQHSIDYYNRQKKGLGRRFHDDVKETFSMIRTTPGYQVRYDNVRCCPLDIFPYMVHYTFEENTIIVYAVIGMAMNSAEQWIKR
jgi:hypothetical protein